MKKKILSVLMTLTLGMSLMGCVGGEEPKPEPKEPETPVVEEPKTTVDDGAEKTDSEPVGMNVTMTIGNFCADEEPGQLASLEFAQKVYEYSDGTVDVVIKNNSELGNAPTMAELTAEGSIQGTLICHATLTPYDARYALVNMPYIFDSYEEAYAVVDGPYMDWVSDGTLESQGLHNVGSWDYGFRNLTNSKRPVEHPEDVQGLSVRTPDEMQIKVCMESLGATVEIVSFSELKTALESEKIDGQENPISTIYNNNLWDYKQRYLTMTKHCYNCLNLVLNNSFWESLSPKQQEAIEKASKEASTFMREMNMENEKRYIEGCKDAGMQVIEAVDMEEFRASMDYAYDQIAKDVGDYALVEKMFEICDSVKADFVNEESDTYEE